IFSLADFVSCCAFALASEYAQISFGRRELWWLSSTLLPSGEKVVGLPTKLVSPSGICSGFEVPFAVSPINVRVRPSSLMVYVNCLPSREKESACASQFVSVTERSFLLATSSSATLK